VLSIPGNVLDVAFSPDESRVLARTGRWIHRALMTPQGLVWTDTIRSPRAMRGSQLTFDSRREPNGARSAGLAGDRVLLLSRAAGGAELVELGFRYSDGPGLFGSRAELLENWMIRLQGNVRPVVLGGL
jgi:hypothetical protein